MTDKIDLTKQCDSELSLRVFNDEGLHFERHRPYFIGLLDQLFIYTEAQLAELLEDLEDDLNHE